MSGFLSELVGGGVRSLKVKCTLDDTQVLAYEDAHVALFSKDGDLIHSEIMNEDECSKHVSNPYFVGIVSAVEYLTFFNMWTEEQKISPKSSPTVAEAKVGGGSAKKSEEEVTVIPDDSDPKPLVPSVSKRAPFMEQLVVTRAIRVPTAIPLEWCCEFCTYSNKLSDDNCLICEAPKVAPKVALVKRGSASDYM